MIFKNRIKKEKLLADIECLNSRIETLSNQVKKFYSTEGELRRILENHMHGEVVGFSNKDERWRLATYHLEYKTYVYKNGREYVFDNLYIENPVFTQGEKENIVYATSGDGKCRYVLDLYNNAFIEIETKESEKENEPK